MTSNNNDLINLAKVVSKNAYAPYSKFAVGCAILSVNDQLYSGANIENLSFGLTICAERAAVSNGVSKEGASFRIKRVAIYTNTKSPITPCGACLQVLREFGSDFEVHSVCAGDSVLSYNINELIPFPPEIEL